MRKREASNVMESITVEYAVSFGNGDVSDVCEYEVEVTDKQYELYQKVIKEGKDPNDIPELQEVLYKAEGEIPQYEAEEYGEADEEFVKERNLKESKIRAHHIIHCSKILLNQLHIKNKRELKTLIKSEDIKAEVFIEALARLDYVNGTEEYDKESFPNISTLSKAQIDEWEEELAESLLYSHFDVELPEPEILDPTYQRRYYLDLFSIKVWFPV